LTDCDRIRADAAGVAALPAGDAEREEAWAHARGCPACARLLDEAERLQAAIGAAVSSAPTTDATGPVIAALRGRGAPAARGPGRAEAVIVSELRREARWRTLASVVAVCAAFVVVVALTGHRSTSIHDWASAFALALAACAAALGAASRRWAIGAVIAAPVAALGLALATGAAGRLRPSLGVECLATELACSVAVVAGAWLVLRRGTSSLGTRAVVAGAAAGALGGAAALQLTCPEQTSLPHVLAFHVLGVAGAAVGAGAIGRIAERARHA
jgi:hypothetical protein